MIIMTLLIKKKKEEIVKREKKYKNLYIKRIIYVKDNRLYIIKN